MVESSTVGAQSSVQIGNGKTVVPTHPESTYMNARVAAPLSMVLTHAFLPGLEIKIPLIAEE